MTRPDEADLPARRCLLVVLALVVLWFAWLGHRDLFEPDEGRYSEIPLEMIASGDWVTPRMHGFKYFEKPPLQYWATAAVFESLGKSQATARLFTAVCGVLGALWAGWVGARLYGRRAGLFAFVVTLSGLLYTGSGHIVTLDMALALFMVLGVGALALAQRRREEPARVRNGMLAGWAALGLAVLVKGPVAVVLPGLAVVVYSLWQRDWALWRHLHLGKGLVVLLAICAPWFAAVMHANPEFAHFFFVHEHWERFTTHVSDRPGPAYYFVVLLLVGMLPWTASTLAALFRPGFRWWPAAGGDFDAERFLWVYAVVVVAFFSASDSKLPPYIVPMLPVLGILVGRRLALGGVPRAEPWLALAEGLALLVLAWQAPRLGTDKVPAALYEGVRPWALAAGSVLIATAWVLWRRWKKPTTAVALAGILALAAYRLVLGGYGELAPAYSSRALAAAIRANTPPDAPVFVLRDYDPNTLPFYLGRPLTLVTYKSELAMGIDEEPQRWIPSEAAFLQRWQDLAQGVAILSTQQYRRLSAQGVPMRVIHRSPRQVAVARR